VNLQSSLTHFERLFFDASAMYIKCVAFDNCVLYPFLARYYKHEILSFVGEV
jgi:hypothetical protein